MTLNLKFPLVTVFTKFIPKSDIEISTKPLINSPFAFTAFPDTDNESPEEKTPPDTSAKTLILEDISNFPLSILSSAYLATIVHSPLNSPINTLSTLATTNIFLCSPAFMLIGLL